MKKNKGYTLIEMIIVIAIMAILSGLAAVSIGLVNKARARDAMQTFQSQLSNTWIRTRATASSDESMYLIIEQTTDGITYKIYDEQGGTKEQKDSATVKKWSTKNDWNSTGSDGSAKTKIVYSQTTLSDDDQKAAQVETGYGNDSKKWYIRFNKSTGAVEKGAGEYTFIGSDGSNVGTIVLDAMTGNHFSASYNADSSAYYVKKKAVSK